MSIAAIAVMVNGAPSPVRAAVEILPDVFALEWIAPDQAGDKVVVKVRGHGEFPAVQRGVAEAVDALVCRDFQRNEISPG